MFLDHAYRKSHDIQDPTPGITKQSAVIASALNDGQ